MFKTAPPLDPGGPLVSFHFEGRKIETREGMNLAAALLANGIIDFHASEVSGAPRGPFCLMGTCFECLVVIDGKTGRQACMTQVTKGMAVHRQHAARTAP